MTPIRQPESLDKLPTKKQVVAGFVVYRRTSDGIKFLLLYRRGNYWNFPKGHFEPGERSIDTALRELEEETGIKKSELRIAPNFRAYERFYFKIGNQGIYDTVILFLAETHKADVSIKPREHSGFGWFLYHDALNILGKKYADTRKVLKQASDFLQPRRKTQPQRTTTAHTARPHHPASLKKS
jgi:8-oxo-dGTP pyrophosphatase MutT (NUDIX family)